jgi:adenine-specific DNA-methyltransferase
MPDAPNTTDSQTSEILLFSEELQRQYEAVTSDAFRRACGHFPTPQGVAAFMAGLFSEIPSCFRLLDPGAGIGTLSVAVCERVMHSPIPRSIHITAYENEPSLIPFLERNLGNCRKTLRSAGHEMTFSITQDDFILSNAEAFSQQPLFGAAFKNKLFDASIMNPPYFKIAGDSPHARLMSRIIHGQPNIYVLFMALAAQFLKPDGELVAITPRSFCSGLYFRQFRRWFFNRMSLQHVHLFASRKATFKESDVLQESLITFTRHVSQNGGNISLSTSHGRDFPPKASWRIESASKVIDSTTPDLVICIPENCEDTAISEIVRSWPNRFSETGLRISTGPVVAFRSTEFLLPSLNGTSTIPLISVHNVRRFITLWPLKKKNKPEAFKVCPESAKLLLPAKNYVLMRRFSAKEEKRRLTASCYLKTEALRGQVAFENHLNYVYHAHRDLTEAETFGIAALFNSAFLDRFFRTISGNTQVNATEIRSLPFPDLATVAKIGQAVKNMPDLSTGAVERIVLDALRVPASVKRYTMGFAT